MTSEFADLHADLRAVANDLLAKEGVGGTAVPWPKLAGAGWVGLEAPDEFGGAGVTFAEVAVILDEMGRAATAGAFLGAGVLGVKLLAAAESPPPLLGQVIAGDVIATACLPGDETDCAADTLTPFTARHEAGTLRVSGSASFVVDAVGADRLLLPTELPGGDVVVVDLPTNSDGVTVVAQPVLDETRHFGTVKVDDAAVPDASTWRLAGDGTVALRRLRERAQVAVACDSLGISEAMLRATVDYVGMRQQFGRAIGSFQAVKHACADMFVQVSVARQLVAAAVDAVVTDSEDSARAAAKAKAYTSDAAVAVAGAAMQLHGGIGYTWESGIHVYLKRATLNRSLFGSPAAHRRWLAKHYR